MDMKELVQWLNERTKEYDEGNPTVSDKEWDDKYFQLVMMEYSAGYQEANSPTQKISWDAVSALNKVKHNHPMLSLAKTKEVDEVKSFLGDSDYIIMAKMDGLTCSLRYLNGRLVSAETRGNGEIGEDILHNASVIINLPLNIPYKDELIVDGEIICDYETFKEFANDYKNPRNFASGKIRSLDPKECNKAHLSFIAWDCINSKAETLMDKLLELKDLGFEIVPFSFCHAVFKNLTEEIEWMKNVCKEHNYPIDGVVFKYNNCEYYNSLGNTEHHFRGGLAFKFYDEEYETRLKYIEWSMGRTGVLTPVAVFEPIDIDGTEVERASLHNYSVMKDIMGDCCYCGQKLMVYKANMIIPQVKSAIKMSYGDVVSNGGITCDGFSNDYGLTCPICEGSTSIVESESGVLNVICDNPQCEGKLINRLDHFCGKKGLDIKGLSKMTLEKLIDWGWLGNIREIFSLSNFRAEWIKKPGFGEKSVDKILAAIEGARHTTLDKFISALGIPLIGTTAAKAISKYVKGSFGAFIAEVDFGDFSELDNFGYEMNKSLKSFDYTLAIEMIDNAIIEIEIENAETEAVSSLEGLVFVITGKLSRKRDDIKADIEAKGGKVTGSVSSKTSYLVCNDKNSNTGKSKDAKALGIPIITEEELNALG